MTGLSPRNLKYMRAFGEAWPDAAIVQQPVAQIPWFHNCVILDKIKNPKERLWYISKTIEKPVGVSSYITKLVESLPAALRDSLPSPKEFVEDLKKDHPE